MNLFNYIGWKLFVLMGLTAYIILFSCAKPENRNHDKPAAFSLDGKPLYSQLVSSKVLEQLAEKEKAYQDAPDNPDNIIWYGRFLAYSGDYEQAVEIFSQGIGKYPVDARFYRHRGHRYITLRKFDLAISDLERASELIKDLPDETEPDGIPNAQNIPVSTLHGNIWYHLGLAYYLQQQFPKALISFLNAMRSGNNHDNLVSTNHWIYTILCRMQNKDELDRALSRITGDMFIIENKAYHRLGLFYKGELSEEQVRENIEEGPSLDAIDYGIARWHACQGNMEKSKQMLNNIVNGAGWASFAYIAAEADLFAEK